MHDPSETWVFDVDGTVVDSLSGTSLRPHAEALLTHLRGRGCRLLLWSAGGAAYARQRAQEHALEAFVDDFHDKQGRDSAGRYVVHRFLGALEGAVFVDDRPEDLPVGAEVVAVSPYLAPDLHDRGLHPAFRRAGLTLGPGRPI
jgi:phosphoglycolate phosphatase-like HAD superfamily hydrolase